MDFLIDGHCDTLVRCANQGEELYENTGQVDFKRLPYAALQFFAICLHPMQYRFAMKHVIKYIDFYNTQLARNQTVAGHVNTYADIVENRARGRISCLLSLEGAEGLEGSAAALRIFYRLGVRCISLTWNYSNLLATGAKEEQTNAPLKSFGRQVLEEMQRLGMLIDVSHLNDGGFYEVASIWKGPFIASHSNARALCPNPRNLTDEQIRLIAQRGGTVGLNLYPLFLSGRKQAGMEDICRHIAHIIKVGGTQVLALGGDLDGIGTTPEGIQDVSRYGSIIEEVEKRFGSSAAQAMLWRNLDNVLKQTLG